MYYAVDKGERGYASIVTDENIRQKMAAEQNIHTWKFRD